VHLAKLYLSQQAKGSSSLMLTPQGEQQSIKDTHSTNNLYSELAED
jgi:hypothetical protein